MMGRFFVVAAALLVLGACSTSVQDTARSPTIDAQTGQPVQTYVAAARAISNYGVAPEVLQALEVAFSREVRKREPLGMPVAVTMDVTQFEVKSGGARFFGGALVGSNKMFVTVQLVDTENRLVREFKVERKSNPGGYGMFYDQKTATVEVTAEEIVKTIYGD